MFSLIPLNIYKNRIYLFILNYFKVIYFNVRELDSIHWMQLKPLKSHNIQNVKASTSIGSYLVTFM